MDATGFAFWHRNNQLMRIGRSRGRLGIDPEIRRQQAGHAMDSGPPGTGQRGERQRTRIAIDGADVDLRAQRRRRRGRGGSDRATVSGLDRTIAAVFLAAGFFAAGLRAAGLRVVMGGVLIFSTALVRSSTDTPS